MVHDVLAMSGKSLFWRMPVCFFGSRVCFFASNDYKTRVGMVFSSFC